MLRNLERLANRQNQRKVLRKSLQAGGTIVRKAFKRAAPVHTGRLAKAMAVKVRAAANPSRGFVIIGPRSGKAWYGHFTESGTVERQTRNRPARSGRRARHSHPTGRVVATHWMSNTFEAQEQKALDRIESKMSEELDKLLR